MQFVNKYVKLKKFIKLMNILYYEIIFNFLVQNKLNIYL
jgi:hypothetical protein